ncbi:coproporphyrinogen III oxidase family protein [Campylobacter sp. RM9344]|uniref:Heme chaperone HemW n=1 Tax=Campylobacter californiensis TaxID=1032243 RepID=A0AAW3ZT95_9BACT|nr:MULTISPECIES: radical SAM family heme chaperone HemW [unclassified Campylobacter]MBE2984791.1 coproporphyrinogen III oxidase family protein [Campylobacter sp. RM6883]MBE2994743.1 coproporphyrinogen III oxidase family protein [Campylobacter sp. RM6913]MBE3029609.1 coproporphyrinogen III oxidase family protein [Campylobacter sp. RM9344]MBE3608315.1 coproporphyrinogen III oxidase family protein [Campylobacter sp. RM9337]QCD50552.1 oxygen-independent coproporphyrinogen III oxidase [Campylobacte
MLLYIHIPFCESKCPYCAFGSVVGKDNLAKSYFDALLKDLKFQIQKFKIRNFKSVFIGGGTPSAVNAKFYEPLFEQILSFCQKDCEITSEANPNSADTNWLTQMRNLGVNRISFGAQSFFEDKLKFLGRTHDAKQIYQAVKNAKISGFKNINIDLIYGTKFDTKKRLSKEVENIKNLEISHVSAYSLTLEPNTPFFHKNEYKKDSPILAKFIMNEIENIGLKQYEISNFGEICKHNLGYWQGKDYAAIGAYAVGFCDDFRFTACANLEKFIADPTQKTYEILSKNDMKFERIFLGARSIVGIEASWLNKHEQERAEILRKSRKLAFKDGKYFVKNFLLADEIALFIVG